MSKIYIGDKEIKSIFHGFNDIQKVYSGIDLVYSKKEVIVNNYILATDSDFSGTVDGFFKYIGNDEFVEIPHIIKGIKITKYDAMFEFTLENLKGVKSTNKNITSFNNMFRSTQSIKLDISELEAINVYEAAGMFNRSLIKELIMVEFNREELNNIREIFRDSSVEVIDLSNYKPGGDFWVGNAFTGSKAIHGYAHFPMEADFLNSVEGKPKDLIFVPKLSIEDENLYILELSVGSFSMPSQIEPIINKLPNDENGVSFKFKEVRNIEGNKAAGFGSKKRDGTAKLNADGNIETLTKINGTFAVGANNYFTFEIVIEMSKGIHSVETVVIVEVNGDGTRSFQNNII